jgi:hypothetical protein
MLITLSGLDGAGKSTLADALQARLEEKGVRAVVLHMNKEVGLYAYLRTARDGLKRLAGFSHLRPNRHDTLPLPSTGPVQVSRAKVVLLEVRRRIIWNRFLRRFVDIGDLGTFLLYRLVVERMRGRVLIMDRYFFDRIADVADGQKWAYLRWFSKFIPRPDVAILVEVSPEEAYSRKGEYSVQSMTRRRQLYQEIFGWVPNAITLRNDDFGVALSQLEQLVFDCLGIAGHQSLVTES